MAWGIYFNMEKLAITIAQKHIQNMTSNNFLDDCFLDDEKLLNNLENGFVAITQLSCLIESFLNTIINSCIGYDNDTLLKCSIDEKIEIIYMHYGKDFSTIKSQNPWATYRKITKVRNSMIHFKKTYIGDGSGTPDFILGGESAANFFTKQNLEKALSDLINLTHLIANSIGLKIFENINIIECNGRDGLVNYVYNENAIEIDESRFDEVKL